ncbi:MinD/ParA family ATP-binding protein [Actinokineospora spheciospongiae]|uniref:MinD/ParA family ATP-binding protein n=1 Tax=Actinokineospora spheciospongiae TaxID=909613 RepID=UPI000D7127A3|nr:MinD/ParA family protein [Actinokineospora spheciospongiae]PWW64195.1 MinD-like ATPase involved in chromosome partitioning or flagellar assembly [Actinokineospora spheciospongiae]
MTGRQDESEQAWGPGGGSAVGRSGPPREADTDTHDFGPAPELADKADTPKADDPLTDDAATDHTPFPEASGPHRVPGPNQSGPHPVPGPGQSGPHAVPGPGQSGPHAVPGPGQSGPHAMPGPGQSGPHAVPGPHQPGPPPGYYSEPTPSGPQPLAYGQGYPQPGMPPQGGPTGYGPPPQQAPMGPPQSDELSSARLLKQAKRAPQSGWRKAVYVVSGHLINVGESPADRHRRELIARVNQPLRGCYKIAMLSLKGGVGKTTTTTTLGSTYSSLRGDRVIAVDANPDRGTLSQKIPLETTATVRHLLRDANRIRRYSDIRAYTSQGPSRLEVLASEQDPAVSEAFSEDDYRRTVALLEHFYNIVLTDCGTGLMHSAMKGVLDIADSLVIVSSGSVDGARSASATLDWLDAHGYRDLVSRSVAVINSVRPKSGSVDLDKLTQHFSARCRAVCRIPFDPHLEEGAEIELERLQPDTRVALLEMAATVADDFPNEAHRRR